MSFDLSGLVPAERRVIGYALLCHPSPALAEVMLALTPLPRRPAAQGALARLMADTKRRKAVLEPLGSGEWYRIVPEALSAYLASKKPKKEAP